MCACVGGDACRLSSEQTNGRMSGQEDRQVSNGNTRNAATANTNMDKHRRANRAKTRHESSSSRRVVEIGKGDSTRRLKCGNYATTMIINSEMIDDHLPRKSGRRENTLDEMVVQLRWLNCCSFLRLTTLASCE